MQVRSYIWRHALLMYQPGLLGHLSLKLGRHYVKSSRQMSFAVGGERLMMYSSRSSIHKLRKVNGILHSLAQ